MKNNHKKQQGLTLISLIFILGFVAIITLLVLKVVPIYLDHSKVVHALESIKSRPEIENQTKNQVLSALNKQFGMNYIDNIKNDNVHITSHYGYLKVQIIYHVKKHIIANLSACVDFDDSIEVGTK